MRSITINSREDISAFFTYLLSDLDLNFHPDTPFEDYVNAVSEQPTFTDEEASHYNDIMQDCFEWCDFHQVDIYEIAIDSFTLYINEQHLNNE